MNKNLIDLNLQFFAEEGESENISEVADPVEGVVDNTPTETEAEVESTEVTEPEAPNVQSAEENAKYAAARRRAEAEFAEKQRMADAEFARRFEGYENPITHEPIRTQRDYFAALDAQEKLKRDEELSSKGIDPKMFEDMVNRQVNNNPYVQQAQQIIQQAQQSQIESLVADGVKAISQLNPSIRNIDDLVASPNYAQIVGLVRNNNMSLVDAYKLANFDTLMAGKVAGAKQAALNNINGTSHLTQTDGASVPDNGEVEIPTSELEQWKKAFPHASLAELRKKYNSTL